MDDHIKAAQEKNEETHEEKHEKEHAKKHEHKTEHLHDEKIEALEKQLADANNAKLRALADYQNLKTRFEKEKEELQKFSQTVLLLKILDIIDDFRNIIESRQETAENNDDAWFNGIKMVYDKFLQVLDSEGVAIIEVHQGDIFDPVTQEAIGFVTITEDEQNNKIAHIVSQGYKMKDGDKVIKNAKVIVNKKQ